MSGILWKYLEFLKIYTAKFLLFSMKQCDNATEKIFLFLFLRQFVVLSGLSGSVRKFLIVSDTFWCIYKIRRYREGYIRNRQNAKNPYNRRKNRQNIKNLYRSNQSCAEYKYFFQLQGKQTEQQELLQK